MAPIFNALMHDHPRQNNHCEYLLDIVRQMPFAVADDLLRAMISTPIAQRLKDKESPLAKLSPERKSQSWHIPARRPVSHTPSSATPPAAQLSSPSANQSANQSVMSRK
jgi:hypothetical protein